MRISPSRLKSRRFLAPVFALLMGGSSAQVLDFSQSPSRPEYWYARYDPGNADWTESRQVVERDFEGLPLELASITTQAENDLVRTVAGSVLGIGVYLGLTDFHREGEWRWLDGTPLTYTDWNGPDPTTSTSQLRFAQDYVLFDTAGWSAYQGGGGNQDPILGLRSDDCDGDLIPDLYEIWIGAENDFNGNGIIDSCDTIGTRFCTATANSFGTTAALSVGGSAAVADNNVYVTVADAPPFSPCLFLASRSQDFVLMFSGSPGNLCLGAPLARLLPGNGGAVVTTDASGFVTTPLDLSLVAFGGPVLAGETWNFQCWMRDVFSSNTSDAVSVTFS